MKYLIHILLVTSSFSIFGQQESLVIHASRVGNVEALELLYQLNPDTLNFADSRGFTPLIIAVYNDQAAAVDFLLSKNVDINSSDHSGNTALMGVVVKGHTYYVNQLLLCKADIDYCNYNGASALIFASTFGGKKLV